jgi:hypothetical protein
MTTLEVAWHLALEQALIEAEADQFETVIANRSHLP